MHVHQHFPKLSTQGSSTHKLAPAMPISTVLYVRANHLIPYLNLKGFISIYPIYPIVLQCALSQNWTHAAVLTGLIT